MKKLKKLNELFPNWDAGLGIFSFLSSQNVPWPTNLNAELDLMYHGNHSGQKIVTPLVTALLDEDETLSPANAGRLASLASKLYSPYWAKEYATLSLVYNPIQNYDMSETENGSNESDGEVTHTGTDNHSTSETHTGTDNHSTSETHTGTDTTVIDRDVTASNQGTNTNGIYGFNSGATAVPADTQTGTNSGTQNEDTTDTKTLNLSDAGTDNRTVNLSDAGADNRTVNLTDSETKTGEFTRTLSRRGNIGVTTSQQMLQSERELWLWNFFEKVVFPDLDKILCMQIY